MQKVYLVVDREFGERLVTLAQTGHVWAIASPANSPVIHTFWERSSGAPDDDPMGPGITSYLELEPGEAADRLCNRLVDEIDIHHGGTGAGQLTWSEIEVFGAPLTDALRSALEDIGGQTFVPTREGFVCRRTVTYPESKPSDRMED